MRCQIETCDRVATHAELLPSGLTLWGCDGCLADIGWDAAKDEEARRG